MPRRRRVRKAIWADVSELDLALGPIRAEFQGLSPRGDSAVLEAFELSWQRHRVAMLDEYQRQRPGSRPWAWWRFDAREDQPSPWEGEEVARLLELDAMSEREMDAVIARGQR